jgi:hypothetical protein
MNSKYHPWGSHPPDEKDKSEAGFHGENDSICTSALA